MKRLRNIHLSFRLWYLTQYVRIKAIILILTHKKFAGLAIPAKANAEGRFETKNCNNMRNMFIFLVPHEPQAVLKTIKILENTYKDMVHKSRYHDGLSVSHNNKKKGGSK